jgi:hypothetical protein
MWAITCSINEYSCNFADTSLYSLRFLPKPQVGTTHPVSHTIFIPGKRNILPGSTPETRCQIAV